MPRVKKPSVVITFESTEAELACEDYCTSHGLPGRTIPVPGQISAGCGTAWKADLADAELLSEALSHSDLGGFELHTIELWEFERA